MSRPPALASGEPGRARALMRLYAAIGAAVESHQPIPCRGDRMDLWLSEREAEQEAASWRCQPCPVLAECRAYITNHPEPAGVWAGLSFADRRQNTRRTA